MNTLNDQAGRCDDNEEDSLDSVPVDLALPVPEDAPGGCVPV